LSINIFLIKTSLENVINQDLARIIMFPECLHKHLGLGVRGFLSYTF